MNLSTNLIQTEQKKLAERGGGGFNSEGVKTVKFARKNYLESFNFLS